MGYFINWYAEASRNDDRPTKCGYFASFFGSVTFLLAGCYIIVDAIHELLTGDEDSIDPKTMVRPCICHMHSIIGWGCS